MKEIYKVILFDFVVANGFGASLTSTNYDIQKLYLAQAFVKFELSSLITSLITVSVLVGMTIGSLISSKLSKKYKKDRLT